MSSDGGVYVVDVQNATGTIFRVDPLAGTADPWVSVGTAGCNGSAMGPDGWLYVAHSGLDAILRVRRTGTTGTAEIDYVTTAGLPFRGPNDLVFHSNGDLYFTDPTWGSGKDQADVFLLRESGELVEIVSNVVTPNGIGLSPDEKTLYVTLADLNKIIQCEVLADGTVGPPEDFIQFTGPGTPDGMCVAEDGTIYQALYSARAVAAISPEGQELWRVALDWDLPSNPTGHNVTNCTLGPNNTLYITRTRGSGRTDNGCLIRLILDSGIRRWSEYR